ncbi:CCD82 protein, partial [Eubucco bourcierii]|nr:CCD82 protein [Eubucco bourcierii]
GKRKRLTSSVLYDSDESEDSDILVRKVFAKRHCIMDDDGSSEEQQPDETENTSTSKKQNMFAKLKDLARQRATQRSCSSENSEDSNEEEEEPLCHLLRTPMESSETDSDSMKDFIVEEEEGDDDNTKHAQTSDCIDFFPVSRCSHYAHFQRTVRAFLINAIDDTFLSSLYDGTRQKKYARDMLLSLHYLDDRFIQPRLENLTSRSRWKERYK